MSNVDNQWKTHEEAELADKLLISECDKEFLATRYEAVAKQLAEEAKRFEELMAKHSAGCLALEKLLAEIDSLRKEVNFLKEENTFLRNYARGIESTSKDSVGTRVLKSTPRSR